MVPDALFRGSTSREAGRVARGVPLSRTDLLACACDTILALEESRSLALGSRCPGCTFGFEVSFVGAVDEVTARAGRSTCPSFDSMLPHARSSQPTWLFSEPDGVLLEVDATHDQLVPCAPATFDPVTGELTWALLGHREPAP